MKHIKAWSFLLCILLWCLGTWLVIDGYRRDFLVVKRAIPLFFIFFVLQTGIALGVCIIGFLKIKPDSPLRVKLEKLFSKKAWIITFIVLKLALCAIALMVMLFVAGMVVAYVSTVELIALCVPYVGFIVLFLIEGIQGFRLLRSMRAKQITDMHKSTLKAGDVIATGFCLLIILVPLITFIYSPNWSTGVEYAPIFVRNEQPNRGYRIPAGIALPGNIMLVFCESREDNRKDWGDIDLVMKRSTDGGVTWSSIRTIHDEGTHTAGNPCPVFDNDTLTVWLPYCVDNKRIFVMNSTDYGLTWSTPIEITESLDLQLSGSDSQLVMEYGTGPGVGIQCRSGRLVIPSYFFDARGAHIIYSDDHGMTWHRGEYLNNGGECQIFQAINGSLCLNCRSSTGFRLIAWSHDEGETWDVPYYDSELEDVDCMASLLTYSQNLITNSTILLYSSPSRQIRAFLSVQVSLDEGRSWTGKKLIYDGPSAYSQILVRSDGTIFIIFEQGKYDYHESITLCSFTYDWLTV